VAAQDRPNLSGTWTAGVRPGSDQGLTPATPPPAWGPEFTLEQDGAALTVHRTFAGLGAATIRYTLDGGETRSRMPGRLCQPDSGAVWTAAWDGAALVVTMVGVIQPGGKIAKADVKSTLRLENPDTLRVDVAVRTAAQAEPRVTSTVYRKTTAAAPAAAAAVASAAKATIAEVGWISGTWVGTTASGATVEERWTPAATGSMMAISRTLRDNAMSAFEFLCIVERDGGLVYQAMPNGRSPATDFTLTKLERETAVFENPAHDFPKMIRYRLLADGSLEATVSGAAGSKPQTFLFKRRLP
jgi:hypothetical protein